MYSMIPSRPIFHLILCTFCVSLCACERPSSVRTYTEIVIESPLRGPFERSSAGASRMDMADDPQINAMLTQSVANLPLVWQTPVSWIEKKGEGIRLATFTTQDPNSIECTIVSLGGIAGGIEANIARWLGQIGLHLSDSELADFIKSQKTIQSKGQFKGQTIDLTQLQKNQNNDMVSIAGVIFDIEGQSVFIKMTGTKDAVKKNFDKMIQLAESIELKK